jgi:hypothetical protein
MVGIIDISLGHVYVALIKSQDGHGCNEELGNITAREKTVKHSAEYSTVLDADRRPGLKSTVSE